jgi:hypothetical protein
MQIGLVIVLGIIVTLFLLWRIPRNAQLHKIFSDEHLIEIAEQFETIKPLAINLSDIDEERFALEDDPRAFITSGEISMYYTIHKDRESNLFYHHFSLKDQYGVTVHGVGATLVLYIARLLNIAPDILTIERSPQHVFHVSFELTQEQERVFEESSLRVPTPTEARRLFRECLEARHTLKIQGV